MAKEPPKPANADWVPASQGLPNNAPDYLREELIKTGMHPDFIQPYWEAVLEAQNPGSTQQTPDLNEWLQKKTADIVPLKKTNENIPSGPDQE